MKNFYVIALFCLLATFHFSLQAQTATATSSKGKMSKNEEEQKQEAAWVVESAQVAKDYVEGLDKGQYAQSWSKGDQLFQHTIGQNEWVRALDINRKDLGNLKSRTLRDQRIAWNPRGLPPGAYMVVIYDSSFDNASKPSSTELLTLRRGSDGKWRVLTYQVN